MFNILANSPFYRAATNVGCYLSMQKGELRTDGIVSDLLSNGEPLAVTSDLPKLIPREKHLYTLFTAGRLRCEIRDRGQLRRGAGVREPVDGDAPAVYAARLGRVSDG